MATTPWFSRATRLLAVVLVGALAAACANNENQPSSNLTGRDGSVTPGHAPRFQRQRRRHRLLHHRQHGSEPGGHRDPAEAVAMAAAVSAVHHHHRGPRRRARHARVQHRAGRHARHHRARLPRPERRQRPAHPHDLLRQGASGGGLQRHLLLVAESARADGAELAHRRQLVALAPTVGSGPPGLIESRGGSRRCVVLARKPAQAASAADVFNDAVSWRHAAHPRPRAQVAATRQRFAANPEQ